MPKALPSTRDYKEDIAVKVGSKALIFGFMEYIFLRLYQAKPHVFNREFTSVKSQSLSHWQELIRLISVSFHVLDSTKSPYVVIIAHRNCHVFKLSVSVAAHVGFIPVGVRTSPTLQVKLPLHSSMWTYAFPCSVHLMVESTLCCPTKPQ